MANIAFDKYEILKKNNIQQLDEVIDNIKIKAMFAHLDRSKIEAGIAKAQLRYIKQFGESREQIQRNAIVLFNEYLEEEATDTSKMKFKVNAFLIRPELTIFTESPFRYSYGYLNDEEAMKKVVANINKHHVLHRVRVSNIQDCRGMFSIWRFDSKVTMDISEIEFRRGCFMRRVLSDAKIDTIIVGKAFNECFAGMQKYGNSNDRPFINAEVRVMDLRGMSLAEDTNHNFADIFCKNLMSIQGTRTYITDKGSVVAKKLKGIKTRLSEKGYGNKINIMEVTHKSPIDI